eukprot:scaffold3280_cov54-Attheya_sp.AAC.1
MMMHQDHHDVQSDCIDLTKISERHSKIMYAEDRTLANDPYSTAATAAAAHKEQEHLRWIVTLQQSRHHHIIYIYRPPFIRAIASTVLCRSLVKTKLTPHTKRYFDSHDTISRDVAGGLSR